MSEVQKSLQELQELGSISEHEPGAVLWSEGDPGDTVIYLLEGRLEVAHQEGSETVVIRGIEPGTLVGEIACLDGRPRSAMVRAAERTRALWIPARSFREFLRRRPDLLEELFWQQVDRVRSLTNQYTSKHQQAITDVLTGLYNFGFFRERLGMELARAAQTGDCVSLVMLDIDHFKHYNDTNGHNEGNEALARVGGILRGAGRRGDIAARYGGEEFVILLYGATSEEAQRYAESVRLVIEGTDFIGGARQPLGRFTISGGVATFPIDGDTDQALIVAADGNLYRAKESGRNRIVAAASAGVARPAG